MKALVTCNKSGCIDYMQRATGIVISAKAGIGGDEGGIPLSARVAHPVGLVEKVIV